MSNLERGFTYSHDNASNAHIWTQPLTHARSLPKRRHKIVVLVTVDDAREGVVRVRRCADGEEDYEEEGLEIEERRLRIGCG